MRGFSARAGDASDGARENLSGLKTSYVGINQRGFDSLPQRRMARKLILI